MKTIFATIGIAVCIKWGVDFVKELFNEAVDKRVKEELVKIRVSMDINADEDIFFNEAVDERVKEELVKFRISMDVNADEDIFFA